MTLNGLSNKKICLLGLGTENISLARFLHRNGIGDITICDKKDLSQLSERVQELSEYNFQFRFGRQYLDRIGDFDIVFRSPGMPLFLPELVKARKDAVEISSAMKLFFDICPCLIIGVTGTKGKGTTSSLIYHILKRSGYNVFLGGNIGAAPFDFFDNLDKEGTWVVLELSSFQLEDMEKSPHIAVVTNLFPEHLKPADPSNPNYHKKLDDYHDAKKNIFRFQTKDDFLVLNFDNAVSYSWANEAVSKVYYFSHIQGLKEGVFVRGGQKDKNREIVLRFNIVGELICQAHNVRLLGEHNLENISAAMLAAYLAGGNLDVFCEAVYEFEALEHRLEKVAERGGVTYYNDSYSTTPEAAEVALKSFNRPTIIILGGASKGADFSSLAELIIKRKIKAVVVIGDEAQNIKKAIWRASIQHTGYIPKILEGAKNMEEIIKQANSVAKEGDVVVLSPACASFGMFKNYKERGKLFKEAVQSI